MSSNSRIGRIRRNAVVQCIQDRNHAKMLMHAWQSQGAVNDPRLPNAASMKRTYRFPFDDTFQKRKFLFVCPLPPRFRDPVVLCLRTLRRTLLAQFRLGAGSPSWVPAFLSRRHSDKQNVQWSARAVDHGWTRSADASCVSDIKITRCLILDSRSHECHECTQKRRRASPHWDR